MSQRLIQFPVRNAFPPKPPEDSPESEKPSQAKRVALQMEEELARKAERTATGRQIAFESIRKQAAPVKVGFWKRMFGRFGR